MRYFNLGKKPGTIQGGKVPLFYNNMEGVYQDPFGRQDEEDAALHNPEEDEELAELAQQYEEEEDEDYIFNREVIGALYEAGINQEDWEYWMDDFLPNTLGEDYTVDELDEFLEKRQKADEQMARDNERADLKRKREEDDSDYDDDFMNYGEPTGNGIGGTLNDPFMDDTTRGVQVGRQYLPPEIARHIGSFREDGEDEFMGVSPSGTYYQSRGYDDSATGRREGTRLELSSPQENHSTIMHELLSMPDDMFEDEEERAGSVHYSRGVRELIKAASRIREQPHFHEGWWRRRKGGYDSLQMPSPMPGAEEYIEYEHNRSRYN